MALVSAVGLAAVLAGCSSTAQAGPSATSTDATEAGGSCPVVDATLNLGSVPVSDLAAIYVGVDQGYFDEVGITLNIEYAGSSAALTPALINGQYDIIWSGLLTALQAAEGGFPLRVIAPSSRSTGEEGHDIAGIIAKKGRGIEDAADLSGKKVAVNALKGLHQIHDSIVIDQQGGDASSVEWVELPLGNMQQALDAGQVDAISTGEPWVTKILDDPSNVLVETMPYAMNPNAVTTGYFVTQDTLSKRADVVSAFQCAVEKSFEYASANVDATREQVAKISEIDPDLLQRIALPNFAWAGAGDVMHEYGESLVKVGAVKDAKTVDEVVTDVMP